MVEEEHEEGRDLDPVTQVDCLEHWPRNRSNRVVNRNRTEGRNHIDKMKASIIALYFSEAMMVERLSIT